MDFQTSDIAIADKLTHIHKNGSEHTGYNALVHNAVVFSGKFDDSKAGITVAFRPCEEIGSTKVVCADGTVYHSKDTRYGKLEEIPLKHLEHLAKAVANTDDTNLRQVRSNINLLIAQALR